MGMSTEGAFTSKADQQTGDGQMGTINEQAGAEGDDEVPGMLIESLFLYIILSLL
jgi:hypothetical protein